MDVIFLPPYPSLPSCSLFPCRACNHPGEIKRCCTRCIPGLRCCSSGTFTSGQTSPNLCYFYYLLSFSHPLSPPPTHKAGNQLNLILSRKCSPKDSSASLGHFSTAWYFSAGKGDSWIPNPGPPQAEHSPFGLHLDFLMHHYVSRFWSNFGQMLQLNWCTVNMSNGCSVITQYWTNFKRLSTFTSSDHKWWEYAVI